MTKVGRAFEEEKQEAIKTAREKEKREIAKSLLDVLSPELVAKKTGLDIEEVKKLASEKSAYEEKQASQSS